MPDTILLELSFLLFLICSQTAVAFSSGCLESNNGRERSGKRNIVGRNRYERMNNRYRSTVLHMLERMLQQCLLVPCLYLFEWDHFQSLQKESTSGTTLGVCTALVAEETIAVMESPTGSCPVSAACVQFAFCFGHFAALMSDLLPNASLDVPPTKSRYVSIPPINILILAIILNMYCLIQSNGFEQLTKKAERLVDGSDSNFNYYAELFTALHPS